MRRDFAHKFRDVRARTQVQATTDLPVYRMLDRDIHHRDAEINEGKEFLLRPLRHVANEEFRAVALGQQGAGKNVSPTRCKDGVPRRAEDRDILHHGLTAHAQRA